MKRKKVEKTKVIRVFETFAGIGAQHKAITNIKKRFEVIGTSEWDARAIMSYSQIHYKPIFIKNLQEIKNWTSEKINEYLSKRTFSLDSKKPSKITRKPRLFKENLVAANMTNNNFPDIKKVTPENIKGADLLTYSFPCQGLSNANMGRGQGIEKSSKSTSNLIWEVGKLLNQVKKVSNQKLPKYLLMENVQALVSQKHKPSFDCWIKHLKKLHYVTYTNILDGTNFGSLQKRKRLLALSILKKYDNFKNQRNFEDAFKKFENKLDVKQRKKAYFKILNSPSNEEIKKATPNNTTSRKKMASKNIDLKHDAEQKDYYFNTLTTKQDRHPNIGMIKVPKRTGKLNKRFITPLESYQIMGFEKNDFHNVQTLDKSVITQATLYRQAGNSIVVPILEVVFKVILENEGGI